MLERLADRFVRLVGVELTDEQRAITAEAQRGTDNILIQALAGCAKTTTLLEILKVLPQRSILFAAFNKGIADEAQARLPKLGRGWLVVVQTFHALGREIVKKHFPWLAVDREATGELVNEACNAIYPGAPFEVRRSAVRLVRFAKEALSLETANDTTITATRNIGATWSTELLTTVAVEQQLLSPKLAAGMIEQVARVAQHAIVSSLDLKGRKAIDFCDYIWLPSALDLQPRSRYKAILLDELQDISAPQAALISRVSLPTTRVIAAGDAWQQIYSWRGSLGRGAFGRFAPRSGKMFPLTMTWRCARRIVQEAQQLVPTLRAAPNAEEGSVTTCKLGDVPLRIAQGASDGVHTFVLSRSNRALLDCALFLWRSGVKFMLNAGQDLLDPLFHLIDRELDQRDEVAFRKSLSEWHMREAVKADQAAATSRREQIDEQRAMLTSALLYAPPHRIKRLLGAILRPNESGVLLSTVHKVKGREAERVFLLRQTFARQERIWEAQAIRDDDPGFGDADEAARCSKNLAIEQEELNIEYVAITRAKTHLIWVDISRREQPALLEVPIDKIPRKALEDAFVLHERAMEQAEAAGDSDAATRFAQRLDRILRLMR